MFLIFVGLLIAAFIENKATFGFWSLVTAGEVAAWRIKWEALLFSTVMLFIAARVVRTVSQNPSRFIGLLPAQIGLAGVLMVMFMVTALVGITVPARLRQREYSLEAARTARAYTLHRAMLEYRSMHGTFPTDQGDKYIEALRSVPDPDGSIAEALRFVDPNGGYAAGVKLASGPPKSKLPARGVALRNVSAPSAPDTPAVSFTSYDLRLPAERRWFTSDEDFIMRDGVIYRDSDPEVSTSTVRRTP